MSDESQPPPLPPAGPPAGSQTFRDFLASGNDQGGFETDDALNAVLPLMEQALETHERGSVAPLSGLADLHVTHGQIWYHQSAEPEPRHNNSAVRKLQGDDRGTAFDVVGRRTQNSDLDHGSIETGNLRVWQDDDAPPRPVHVVGYRSWENLAGHHDALTDIYSLGLLLASLATGLDFSSADDLGKFAASRAHLHRTCPHLHPAVASAVLRMTELRRHDRAQDLRGLIGFLRNYRDQSTGSTWQIEDEPGFVSAPLDDRRKLIHAKLRDRLFEVNKRNRLIYFRSTMQTVNLTVASVPTMLDYRNIRPDQLFIWQDDLAADIAAEKSIPLNRYLRVEEHRYLPASLDGIRREANRDRKEYGFAQLRLVLTFLRWHNLKEERDTRIHSPLLLLPVELTKKKGVRDTYHLGPTGTVAEVNPVLRHHLKQLYNLDLPEAIDLAETSVDALHAALEKQIKASEPAVELKKIDRPKIDLIQETARKRLDMFLQRRRVSGRTRNYDNLDYSYRRDNFQPLGLQLFLHRVQPGELPLEHLMSCQTSSLHKGASHFSQVLGVMSERISIRERRRTTKLGEKAAFEPPYDQREQTQFTKSHSFDCAKDLADRTLMRDPHLARRRHDVANATPAGPVMEKKRESYHLRQSSEENPYVWDFDLCSLTLGNFNYRKMSLVRDYNLLLSEHRPNPAFEEVFSLDDPDAAKPAIDELPMDEQHLIVPADPTQISAVAAARSGRNLIIQGPPGTGKSQTITNLIADHVANGKKVLFVCEKRAALDVVYHRLASRGLDAVTCLIHDSQADKKSFIHDLKETYHAFTDDEKRSKNWESLAADASATVGRELDVIDRFATAMSSPRGDGAYTVEHLLSRLVALGGQPVDPDPDDPEIPAYQHWVAHGPTVHLLAQALADIDLDPVFARSPYRHLHRRCYAEGNPVATLKSALADARRRVLEAKSSVDTFSFSTGTCCIDELLYLSFVSESARFLARHNLLSLLDPDSAESREFDRFQRQRDRQAKKLGEAKTVTANWKIELPPAEAEAAMRGAVAVENSIFRFFNPAFWKLRSVMRSHYDFSAHAVAPAWSVVLSQLLEQHREQASLTEIENEMADALGVTELDEVREKVREFNARRLTVPVDPEDDQEFFAAIMRQDEATVATVEKLASMQDELRALLDHLDSFLVEPGDRTLEETLPVLDELDASVGLLHEILPELTDLQQAPDTFFEALRTRELSPGSLEHACATKSLHDAYREDRSLKRFEGWILRRHSDRIRDARSKWMNLNGDRTVARVREVFRAQVELAEKPASQLDFEGKEFKKSFSRGRRELEHEFGKSMRYRSIRDLSRGDSGKVVMALKPVWLMSPLSISDTISLGEVDFDVVVFDEASQIRLEEAVPALYRAAQVVVVGDEMQLPPTDFFASKSEDENTLTFEDEDDTEEYDLGADSFLSHVGNTLASTMLGWHYRSHYEALIGFSNAHFYNGKLKTIPDLTTDPGERDALTAQAGEEIPDRTAAILSRSISFHFQANAVYHNRRNTQEANYIAVQTRELLMQNSGLSIGIVAFSEAQQSEIESALDRLGDQDDTFRQRLAEEYEREEDGQFCGLFVKNLENVQGDERDIMLLSICYGPDEKGKMRMNFGPINRTGGEKRLNVIFSRAKRHMVIVSSIRTSAITNDYNDGARCLKTFLEYAEAVSEGNTTAVDRILGTADHEASTPGAASPLRDAIRDALTSRGFLVDTGVGQSQFRCDLGVRNPGGTNYRLGILLVDQSNTLNASVLERYVLRPALLKAFGWNVFEVLAKDWYDAPDEVLGKIQRLMADTAAAVEDETQEIPADLYPEPEPQPEPEPEPEPEAAPEPAATPPPIPQKRTLTDTSGDYPKFWEIEREGTLIRVRFGKLGTRGQTRERTLDSEKKAITDFNRSIRSKLRKGYQES